MTSLYRWVREARPVSAHSKELRGIPDGIPASRAVPALGDIAREALDDYLEKMVERSQKR
jgi:hypothetical protein